MTSNCFGNRERKEGKSPNPLQISGHIAGVHKNTPLSWHELTFFLLTSPKSRNWHVAAGTDGDRGTHGACQLSGIGTQVLMLVLAAHWKPDLEEPASKKRKGPWSTFLSLVFKIRWCACME